MHAYILTGYNANIVNIVLNKRYLVMYCSIFFFNVKMYFKYHLSMPVHSNSDPFLFVVVEYYFKIISDTPFCFLLPELFAMYLL